MSDKRDTIDTDLMSKILLSTQSIHETPTLDAWEQDMFIREAMIQHDLDLCNTDGLPNVAIIAVLAVDMSMFMFVTAILWSRPQFAVFYTPSQICSGITLMLMFPVKQCSWWPVRNLIVLVFAMINFLNVVYCALPFMDDCYRFWAYMAADHALCDCFPNTNVWTECTAFLFAFNTMTLAVFVFICTYKVRACDKYF